jgi:hypothetical protein
MVIEPPTRAPGVVPRGSIMKLNPIAEGRYVGERHRVVVVRFWRLSRTPSAAAAETSSVGSMGLPSAQVHVGFRQLGAGHC